MMYTVRVWNRAKSVLSQTADLPTCMTLLSVVFTTEWTDADLINDQTGEIVARWTYNSDYGVTTG